MFKKLFIFSIIIFTLSLTFSKVQAEEIVIGTTHELKPIMESIVTSYQNKHNDTEVLYVIGSKNELQDLIKEPECTIDLLFLDNINIIKKMANDNILNKESISILGTDNLCIIVKKSIAMRAFMLYPQTMATNTVAIGNPGLCSLGKYTKEALKNYKLWEKFSPKLALFQDNDTVISFIKRGQYDGGITYCSFAKRSFVHITDYINPSLHSPIIYTSGVNATRNKECPVYKFNKFLKSQKTRQIMKEYQIK